MVDEIHGKGVHFKLGLESAGSANVDLTGAFGLEVGDLSVGATPVPIPSQLDYIQHGKVPQKALTLPFSVNSDAGNTTPKIDPIMAAAGDPVYYEYAYDGRSGKKGRKGLAILGTVTTSHPNDAYVRYSSELMINEWTEFDIS